MAKQANPVAKSPVTSVVYENTPLTSEGGTDAISTHGMAKSTTWAQMKVREGKIQHLVAKTSKGKKAHNNKIVRNVKHNLENHKKIYRQQRGFAQVKVW